MKLPVMCIYSVHSQSSSYLFILFGLLATRYQVYQVGVMKHNCDVNNMISVQMNNTLDILLHTQSIKKSHSVL